MRLAACRLGLVMMLGGCGATPFEYRSHNEIPEGPGLLSGDAGAFSLRPGEALPPPDSQEYREFQEWREWKRRNAK